MSTSLEGIRLLTDPGVVENNWRILIGALKSGLYTPVVTNGANATSSVALSCHYMRLDHEVSVAGAVAITPTAINTNTQVSMVCPINSVFTTTTDAGGTGTEGNRIGMILGNTGSNPASVQLTILSGPALGQFIVRFLYQYTIKP